AGLSGVNLPLDISFSSAHNFYDHPLFFFESDRPTRGEWVRGRKRLSFECPSGAFLEKRRAGFLRNVSRIKRDTIRPRVAHQSNGSSISPCSIFRKADHGVGIKAGKSD